MRRKLGRFETAATLTNRHASFVVVIVLELDHGPSPERLAAVLAALQQRHPLLGVRIVERAGKFWFEPEGTPPIPLRVVGRTAEETWVGVVEDELNGSFDAATGPLLRCTYVTPSGPADSGSSGVRSEIVLTFHHAAMDAVSGYALLDELLRGCDPATDLGAEATAAADPGLPPAETRFPPEWRGVRRSGRLAAFLGRQLADEVAYRFRARGSRRAPIPRSARCRVLSMELSEEAASALARAARRRRVTVNGALTASFLGAVNRKLYGDGAAALRYIAFADLRPHVVPPVGDSPLGAYLAMLRYTARMRPAEGFWGLAREVSLQVAGGGRRGDTFGSLWMSEWVMRTLLRRGNERMAATAVSYSGVDRLGRSFGATELRGLHAFVSNFELGPEYTAVARLLNGRLTLDCVYLDGDMDGQLAEAIADEILAILRGAAEEG